MWWHPNLIQACALNVSTECPLVHRCYVHAKQKNNVKRKRWKHTATDDQPNSLDVAVKPLEASGKPRLGLSLALHQLVNKTILKIVEHHVSEAKAY